MNAREKSKNPIINSQIDEDEVEDDEKVGKKPDLNLLTFDFIHKMSIYVHV